MQQIRLGETPSKKRHWTSENNSQVSPLSVTQNSYTPIQKYGTNQKRLSYSMNNRKEGHLKHLISERMASEKLDILAKLGGQAKATAIESQIVCLSRDDLVDLVLTACAEQPNFYQKVNRKYLDSLTYNVKKSTFTDIHK
ncbi:uncharacterized protein CMU_017580 [Cryptosporidium muris RN66]|uniref:Uncharacterized protein n=1 Tax=Cryptosporidium muris (strain RN66) TaxID=441375 RepID=B6AD01_CRYMR|nr:uncharacterized protein CMU_017580 [Cryptosporidium muris RN66]EEA06005.1 hypothetical protein CMU_017580 [Cryptosporidium muris RN66]|eukprot:XP_002140354.1 hypothetical protein [Cryptosporidium muris RN66]